MMEHLAAGIQGGKKRAMVGGTLAANPLSCVAGYHTILEIEKHRACERAGAAGDRLTARQFVLRLRELTGTLDEIYRETPTERTRARQDKLARGVAWFLQQAALD